MGVYAVSIFFILSGLSLRHVYQDKIVDRYDVTSFILRRLFRIAPLFWLSVLSVVALQAAAAYLNGRPIEVDFYQLFLNVTLLFGFIQPDAYMSTGAWSIGNEIVYYSLVPILFYFMTKYRARSEWITVTCLLVSILIAIFFAFEVLDKSSSVQSQWAQYINPFNNFFLFIAGVVIGREVIHQRYIASAVLVITFLIFILLPTGGDRISIITGYNRFILSFCCIGFVWAVYSLQFSLSGLQGRFMSFLGQGCYSIYLMHPIVAIPVARFGGMAGLPLSVSYFIAGLVTLVVSWLTFKFIEKPMIGYGKSLTAKIKSPDSTLKAAASV